MALSPTQAGSTPPPPPSRPATGPDLRAILDAIGDAVFVHDGASGALLDANAAACALYGHPRETIPALDVGALSANEPPYTQADAMRLLQRARIEGPQSASWLARHRDGNLFWVEINAGLGAVAGQERFFVTVRDISLRRAAEEQLRASEATYRGLLDSISEEICVQDADGRILELNRAAGRLFGLPREKLLGRSPAEFAAPGRNDFQRMHDAVRQTFAGRPQLFEFWCRRVDGTLLPREVSVTPGRFFDRPAAIAVLRDISERKQVEAERERAARVLRESEERFRLLLGRVPSLAVQGYSPDATVRYWNEASERLYGYTASEALGRNLIELIIPPALRQEVREAIRTMAETGQALPAGDLELMRKDGSPVSVHSSHAVVRTAHAGVQLYCLDVDLTERKRAERERLEMQQRALRGDKLESLAVLAGGVAHDFNNLLTAVLGNLDLARVELAAEAPALVSVDSAYAAARAAAELARQMLAFSGRSRMMLAGIDLHAFVGEQLEELARDTPGAEAVEFRPGPAPASFIADTDQLRQVIRNIVLNALEAARETAAPRVTVTTGPVTAGADLLEQSRTERKPPPGDYVSLEVTDNGPGMSEETQRRMFDPFFTTRFAGRGLGLAVVMGVVRAHRGAILVRSAPGRGTSVRVLFPVARTQEADTAPPVPPAPAAAPAPAGPPPPARPLVLLVDDDPFVRTVFTRMAPLLGLDLVAAETGEEGVRMFQPRAEQFAAVILDLTLPGMSGWECHDVLRALRPGLPIVVSSGSTTDAFGRDFASRGIAHVLPKPFTIEGLQQALQAVGIRTHV